MKRYTDSQKLLIIKDYYDHKNSYYYWTLEKTALNYGISQTTIWNWMRKFGYKESK